MSKIEQELISGGFIRINRSYIVNINFIDSISGNLVETPLQKLPIGSNYKDCVKRLYS
jgi:DNA-binding LytR/AlgR family response regulator